MGRFNEYGRRASEIIKAAFEEYAAAEATMKEAENRRRLFPQRYGVVSTQYEIDQLKAQADYAAAVGQLQKVRAKLQTEIRRDLDNLRREMAGKVAAAYAMDPERVDDKALALLRSGAMGVNDYAMMFDKALDADDVTMARLIASFAAKAADEREKNPSYGRDQAARMLRSIEIKGDTLSGDAVFEAYDGIVDAFGRATANPSIMSKWDELINPIVESM